MKASCSSSVVSEVTESNLVVFLSISENIYSGAMKVNFFHFLLYRKYRNRVWMLVDDKCNSCCWMNCDVWMMQRSIIKSCGHNQL
jgi:hypothetical protein